MVISCYKLCDERDVEFIRVEDQGSPGWFWVPVGLVQQLKEPCSDVHWNSHDDALRHTGDQSEMRSGSWIQSGGNTTQSGLQIWDLRTSFTTYHLTELDHHFPSPEYQGCSQASLSLEMTMPASAQQVSTSQFSLSSYLQQELKEIA